MSSFSDIGVKRHHEFRLNDNETVTNTSANTSTIS